MNTSLEEISRNVRKDRLPSILNIISQLTLISFILILCSCSSVRGLPDHGGGKRFDEEQRLISSSVQTAIDSMDLSLLKGKKVKLVIDGVETSGGGRTTWTGIRHYSPSWNIREAGPGVEFTTQNHPLGYNVDASYTANNNLTSRDMKYLEFILKMRCELEGIQLVHNQQDINLLVAVDVLGTNRSRHDHILVVRDHLHASTELTYCYIDVKSKKVLKEKSKVGSRASYSENWVRLTNIKGESRKLTDQLHTPYQLPSAQAMAVVTQPRREVENSSLERSTENDAPLLHLEIEEPSHKPKSPLHSKKSMDSGAEELYKQGLEAIKRKDKATLKRIIDELMKKFPKSEYIEILKNRLGRRYMNQDGGALAIIK